MSKLKERILTRIRSEGPISVAEYMALCLLDPVDGYYPTRDPLGSDGDFITAPEISQMFGEVLGLWVLQTWQDLGRPPNLTLVELGPGRGIMMSDILRAVRLDADFVKAANIVLIEASAALEAVQAKTLADSPIPVSWAASLAEVPADPMIVLGNEFLDCLPIRQFIQTDRFAGLSGWHERVVTENPDRPEKFTFAVSPEPISKAVQAVLPPAQADAKNDDLLEACPASHQILDQLAERFEKHPGRALFIDYGPEFTEFGDTLQALKRHEKVGVFSDPGHTDLTARVDFEALTHIAKSMELAVSGPAPQQEFLSKLGIEMRAVALARSKPDAKAKISRQLARLMDTDQMGQLFKAICFSADGLPVPLGFRKSSR